MITIITVVAVVTEDGGDGVVILSSYGDDYADVILCRL
jgi:hypothetical protein